MEVKREYRIGAKKKATPPRTSKPFKNLLPNQNKKPLMTNKNSPKVTMVMGMVKITKIGLTKVLSKANTAAAIKAEK